MLAMTETDQQGGLSALARKPVYATVALFTRLDTYAVLVALFLLATGGDYLTERMRLHAEGVATLTSVSAATGPLHLAELAVAYGISTTFVLSRWRAVARILWQLKAHAAAVLLALVSCAWSVQPLLSLRSSLYLLLSTLYGLYLVRRYPGFQLVGLLTGLGAGVAALSLVTALALPDYAWTVVASHRALQGVCASKNAFGQLMVLLLTPVLCCRDLRRAVRATYVTVFMVLIAASFSAQAWVAVVLSICFVTGRNLIRRMRLRDAAWVAYMGLLPLSAGAVLLLVNYVVVLQSLGKDPTLTGRVVIWEAVLDSVLKRPVLGWGYGAFWQGFVGESAAVLLRVHFPIAQSQNGFLEVLLSLGFVGLAFVTGTFAHVFQHFIRGVRLRTSELRDWYLLIVLLTIYYSFGEANLLLSNFTWILYVIASAGMSRSALHESGALNRTGRAFSVSNFELQR